MPTMYIKIYFKIFIQYWRQYLLQEIKWEADVLSKKSEYLRNILAIYISK